MKTYKDKESLEGGHSQEPINRAKNTLTTKRKLIKHISWGSYFLALIGLSFIILVGNTRNTTKSSQIVNQTNIATASSELNNSDTNKSQVTPEKGKDEPQKNIPNPQYNSLNSDNVNIQPSVVVSQHNTTQPSTPEPSQSNVTKCNDSLRASYDNLYNTYVVSENVYHDSELSRIGSEYRSRGIYFSGAREAAQADENQRHNNTLNQLLANYQIQLASINCL